MEQNNSTGTGGAPVENGSNVAQEVSSTTQPEPTKRSLRVQTWKKIQENKYGVGFNAIFNRIPGFVDSDKAAALLAETDEFKKATNVKVNIDRALHAAKLQTLVANKNLYLPATRDSSAICLKVDVPADATEEQKKEILHVQDMQQHRTEINLDNKVTFDMVIIGSVVVSREGHRIGRGNGFTDLDIGLLIEIGAITKDTVIATLVHDVQVVDTLPHHLFQKYDTPVDMIVTPTNVIRVAKRLPRPAGIFWELLSERRLKIVPILKDLKENAEKAGKVIVLKEENTDVEANMNNRSRRRGPMRRRFGRRTNQRRTTSQGNNGEQQGDGDSPQKRNQQRRNRRFTNRRRRPAKSEGDQSGNEGGKPQQQDRKGGNSSQRRQRPRKSRPARDFCIKLSNITRDIRVKDLKSELRKRECNPLYITWKGQFGKCYLHFGNRSGAPSTEEDIDKVLKSLNDLSLTIPVGGNKDASSENNGEEQQQQQQPQQTKTISVNVELVKFEDKKAAAEGGQTNGTTANGDGDGGARIESVDTTTV